MAGGRRSTALTFQTRRASATFAAVGCGAMIALASCGSSGQTSTSTAGTPPVSSSSSSTSTTAPASSATSPPAAAAASPVVTVPVCSLLAASQLTALLGEAPASAGNEHVFDSNYKSCAWFGASSANMVSVAVNICDCTENQLFNHNKSFGTAVPYPGVGDHATLSTAGSSGMFAAALTAVKGRVAVDLTFQSPVDPVSVTAQMVADVQQILPRFQ